MGWRQAQSTKHKAGLRGGKQKIPEVLRPSGIQIWYHQQESNLYLALRRHSFYPLNYGGTAMGF